MLPTSRTHVSESIGKRFVGRQQALDVFYQRFAYRHMKNAVYYFAYGGVGKTWVLQKIVLDNQSDPTRTVTDIIDFFDTQNQSVYGLQATIRSRLDSPEVPGAFQTYDAVMTQFDTARSDEQAEHTGLLASLESRANKVFIECCKKAIIGREVILLFDTLERVQQRHVGQWLLKEFLPQIPSLIVALAGRPFPALAEVPDNVVPYQLGGLELVDVRDYVRRTWPLPIPDDIVRRVWEHTGGNPLLVDLIFDLTSEKFIRDLGELDHVSRIRDSHKLKRELAKHFHAGTELDRVIWATAFLKRRFDLPMLKYIVENGELLSLDATGYEHIVTALRRFKFVKEYPELQSHLLHDEMQETIEQYLLEDVDPRHQIRDGLYGLIVLHYYPEKAIEEALARDDRALVRQLQSEQLGYVLDKDLSAGLERYKMYRDEIENNHDYDFEELLWGEVRNHLDLRQDKGYADCLERGQWLVKHRLYAKAQDHFDGMKNRFESEQIEVERWLGFVLIRQGEFEQAIQTLEDGLKLVPENDPKNIAEFHNHLGQANRASGAWDRALDHYTYALRAFTLAGDRSGMAGVYLNRGFLYAVRGQYSFAIQQCNRAIELLKSLPQDDMITQRRRMYAEMNLGTAYRHSGEYDEAVSHYEACLDLARRSKDEEVICNALQHLGVNACLQGRRLRETGGDLSLSCRLHLSAFQNLTKALQLAQAADWELALGEGLNRIAIVYEEIYRLTVLRQDQVPSIPGFDNELQRLCEEAGKFQPPGEVEYEHDLLLRKQFSQLNWIEKASQLFELSVFFSDQANDIHRALDSLMELSKLLLELRRYDLVRSVVNKTDRIKGYDYQADLFSAMAKITLADLDFEKGNCEAALEKYVIPYAIVAKQTGYASYLLTSRLKDLNWRVRSLPCETAIRWCDVLEERWLAESVADYRPDMIDILETIRFDALAEKLKHNGTS